jgi:hypothetical protein
MATIVVGDIHGNLPALTDILDQIRPAPGAGAILHQAVSNGQREADL